MAVLNTAKRRGTTGLSDMNAATFNVLFLCTGNSARSILAESILTREGGGRFRAFSAGSHPKESTNPLAIETLVTAGYPTAGLRSKSWDEFDTPSALKVDFVITVCDNAAREPCPAWPGHPVKLHWNIEDPAEAIGTHEQRLAAFSAAFHRIKDRILLFIAQPPERP